MTRMRTTTLGVVLPWATLASAGGSSVGGGTLSNDEVGFKSSIPGSYNRFEISSDQNVRMYASPIFINGKLEIRILNARLLANEQPQWMGRTDRVEFHNHYTSLGWQLIAHPDPCVEMFEKVNPTSITRLLSWGDGRGIIFISTVGQEWDVKSVSDSVRLAPGACSWK